MRVFVSELAPGEHNYVWIVTNTGKSLAIRWDGEIESGFSVDHLNELVADEMMDEV